MPESTRRIISKISLVRQQANEFMKRELGREGFNDVETAHGSIFEVLLTNPSPVSMKVFVERTGRAKSTITGVIDTLEARGYVTREPIPEDRRQVGVVPTEKTDKLMARFADMSDRLLEAVYRDFSTEERITICAFLDKIHDNLSSANSAHIE